MLAFYLLSTACSGGTGTGAGTNSKGFIPANRPHTTNQSLYVLNAPGTNRGSVTVYNTGGSSPILTITNGVNYPNAIAVNSSGTIFVANGNGEGGYGSVTVYPAGQNTPSRTITNGVSDPTSLAIDSNGNLYVANWISWAITVYAPGKSSPLRTITSGVDDPIQIALDSSDNLYSVNVGVNPITSNYDVTAYAADSSALVASISTGSAVPHWAVTDSSNDVFIADSSQQVKEFSELGQQKLLNITNGVSDPIVMAVNVNGSGNLFVSNVSEISVFQPGNNTPSRKITDGLVNAQGFAFDSAENLFVANDNLSAGGGSVNVYASGSGTVSRKITNGIDSPTQVIVQ